MNLRATIPLVTLLMLLGCASAPVQPAYHVALPSCAMGTIRVCDNFASARSPRSCACIDESRFNFE